MKYLTNSGLSYFLNKIKAYIASQLNSKASVIHTHTKSDIIDLPNGYVVDSTLDGTSSNAISNSAVVDALDGKSNAGHTHTKSEITDFPTLATVATSGSYNDLTNKPTTMTPKSHTHGNITNTGAIGTTANKPLITTTNGVITTGSFGTTANTFCQGNDSRLSDARAPTVHTHSASDITSGLATVATSGSYNDLDDRPTIPTVNNATLKIQKNGTDIKTFTANASSNVTCNITVPTKTSDLTNDSGFLTSHQSLSNYSTLANTIKSLSISGKTITYTKGDNTTGTLTTQDTTYTLPTASSTLGGVKTTSTVSNSSGYTACPIISGVPYYKDTNTTYSLSSLGIGNVKNYDQSKAIKSISRSGTTFTYTCLDGTTGTFTQQDNNTTYSFSDKNVTLAWGTKSTIATVGGTDIHVTMPANPNTNTWTAMKGATSSANGSVGYVNAVPPKDGYNTKYLRADGTWQVPPDHTYTVNNATLTIQKNGTTVKTFTANASSNVTCNITVPTKVSQLTNDSGFLTSHQSLSGYVPRSGGTVLTGKLFARTVDNDSLLLESATSSSKGAFIEIFGASRSDSFTGRLHLVACNSNGQGKYFNIHPDGTLTWDGSAIQYLSDQRYKQQISQIDNDLLDAWEDVLPCQFKYNEAVNEKGDNARLHTGYVVQQIDEACKSHNLDISAYGLYCHEEYPERTEEVEVKQDDGSVIKETKVLEPAREHYSLRYTEALIVECAYLRRENTRMKEKLVSLEERLEKLEKAENQEK